MSQRHIQIVDSDATAALVTQRGLQMLLRDEVDIQVAPSPDAAWHSCMNNAVDLLIVDPHPQNAAATALIKTLRTYRPHVTLLVLTAYDSPLLRSQMRSLGVEHYVAKPIDLFDLGKTVRTALGVDPAADSDDRLRNNHHN